MENIFKDLNLKNKYNMKKNFVFILLLIGFGASAQELTSKKGTPILPEAGDWSIGIDAKPFLDYAGNMFNGNASNSSPSFNWTSTVFPQIITGKLVKDANTAYRVKLRLGSTSAKQEYEVKNDLNTASTAMDVEKISSTNIALSAGIQKWKGKGRLRGFYGAEFGIGLLGVTKDVHEYANAITSTNTAPTTSIPDAIDADGYRITESSKKVNFNFGVGSFIGVEYFFAPKMSLSGEFNWRINYWSYGAKETTGEKWNGTSVETRTSSNPGKSSSFGFDNGNAGGSIAMNFYF
jgi:hypothetical protein